MCVLCVCVCYVCDLRAIGEQFVCDVPVICKTIVNMQVRGLQNVQLSHFSASDDAKCTTVTLRSALDCAKCTTVILFLRRSAASP